MTDNPFNLPDDHWALAQSKEERVKRMILHKYDTVAIQSYCRVDRAYVLGIATKYDLTARDRMSGDGGVNEYRHSHKNLQQTQY